MRPSDNLQVTVCIVQVNIIAVRRDRPAVFMPHTAPHSAGACLLVAYCYQHIVFQSRQLFTDRYPFIAYCYQHIVFQPRQLFADWYPLNFRVSFVPHLDCKPSVHLSQSAYPAFIALDARPPIMCVVQAGFTATKRAGFQFDQPHSAITPTKASTPIAKLDNSSTFAAAAHPALRKYLAISRLPKSNRTIFSIILSILSAPPPLRFS